MRLISRCALPLLFLPIASAAAQSIVPTGPASRIGLAGDVNGDGYVDSWNRVGSRYETRSGADNSIFSALTMPATLATYLRQYRPLLGDLDGDGCDDLAYMVAVPGPAQILSGADGRVLFVTAHPIIEPAIDYNSDGYDDLMVQAVTAMTRSRTDFEFRIRSGRDFSLLTSRTGFTNNYDNSSFVGWGGDFDGDGAHDLLSFYEGFGLQVTTIEFASGTRAPLFSAGAFSLGDVDGDSADDLGLRSPRGFVSGATQQLDLTLQPMQTNQPLDIDGDGFADLLLHDGQVVSGRTRTVFPGTIAGQIALFLPTAQVGDIDRDGRDEVQTVNSIYQLVGGPSSPTAFTRGVSGVTSQASRPRIDNAGAARVGGTLIPRLRGAGGQSLAFLAWGTAGQMDLGPLGAPGNHAYFSTIAATTAQFTDTLGRARQTLAIPNDAGLLGVNLTLQWFVADAPANALGVVASEALDITVGS